MEEQISRIAQTVQSNLGLPEEQQPLVLRYARRAVNRICIFCSGIGSFLQVFHGGKAVSRRGRLPAHTFKALFFARRAVNRICIFCSRKDLPEPLEDVAAQMVEDMLRADQAGAGGGNEGSSGPVGRAGVGIGAG